MSFSFEGVRYQGFDEFIGASTSQTLTRKRHQPPAYAHPIDEALLALLDKTMLTPAIADWLDSRLAKAQSKSLYENITVSSKNFPDAHEAVVHCARTLDIPIPHVYVSHHSGLNAMTTGTDEYAYIEITSGILRELSPDELRFVIGHECGHLAADHAMYRAMADILIEGAIRPIGLGFTGRIARSALALPLSAWSRRAEITADRAGLICCGNLDIAEQALVRILIPDGTDARIDVDDYLRRIEQVSHIQQPGKLSDLNATHPAIYRRIRALRLFARSKLYYRLLGLEEAPGSSLLTDQQLNNAVGQAINR